MLDVLERLARVIGAGLYAVGFSVAAVGAARGRGAPVAGGVGLAARIGASAAYALTAVPYAIACVVLWHPIPVDPSASERTVALVVATILGVAGFALYVGGHVALGASYDVSSGLGTVVHEGAPLVTSGPYVAVRHPMYVGVLLGALAGLALYRTWTFVFVAVSWLAIARKARVEDRLLVERYGEAAARYQATTPAFVPRIRRRRASQHGPRAASR